MIWLYVICTISRIVISINAAPTLPDKVEDNSFKTAIGAQCQNISQLQNNQSEIFEVCIDFYKINHTRVVSPNNTQNVLCLLYFDRLTSYCHTNSTKLEYPTLNEVMVYKFDIEPLCTDVVNYSHSIFSNNITRLTCLSLCADFNGIRPECLWAHYYNNAIQKYRKASLHDNTHDNTGLSSSIQPLLKSTAKVDDKKVTPENVHVETVPRVHQADHDSGPANNPPQVPRNSHMETQGTANLGNSAPKGEAETGGTIPETETAEIKPKKEVTVAGSERESISLAHAANSVSRENSAKPNSFAQADSLVPRENSVKPKPLTQAENPIPRENSAKPDSLPRADKPIPREHSAKPNPLTQADIPVPRENSAEVEDSPNHEQLDNEFDNYDDHEMDSANNNAAENTQPQQLPVKEVSANHNQLDMKPNTLQENPIADENLDEIDGESYFLSYFMVICVLIVLGYVGYHNRIKVMALLLEGKRNKRHYRGRRPNSANYHKLDSNLEEAITSNVTKNSNNVIY